MTDAETDDLKSRPQDQYRRPFGLPLWEGGPILGGDNWREFASAADARRRESAPLPRVRRAGGVWES